jgi:hypothetical protein
MLVVETVAAEHGGMHIHQNNKSVEQYDSDAIR